MRSTEGRRRGARGTLVTSGFLAGALLLTGCGDMQPEDLQDLFDQTRDIIDQVEEAVDEQQEDPSDPEYTELMREAREDWDTYVEPPPDIPPNREPYATYTTERDGSHSAREKMRYPPDEAEPLTDYYTEKYGSEPTVEGDKKVWTSETSTTTMETLGTGDIETDTRWVDPGS